MNNAQVYQKMASGMESFHRALSFLYAQDAEMNNQKIKEQLDSARDDFTLVIMELENRLGE